LGAIGKRRLGSSTLEVSVVGLGGNNFGGRIDFAATGRVVHKAIDLGINLIDTADSYGNKGGSEEWLGRILGAKRKDIVLATKFGLPMDEAGELKGASRRYIMRAVEASLKRLNTDWIDLYQLHRPDPQTPIEETLRALDDLLRAGKVRWIGCSNLAGRELVEAQTTARRHGLARILSGRIQPARARRRARARADGKIAGNGTIALFPARQRPLDRKVRTRRGAADGIAAGEEPASRAAVRQRTQLARRRRACGFRRAPRSHLARARVQLALTRQRGCQRHCRRHHRAAGRAERARGRLDIVGRVPRSTASRCRIFRKAERTDRLTTRGARRGARRAGFRCASGGKAARPGHPT
jgi:aryl-alcohol dehydrogenase-like predicted oxidoreductase